MHDVALCMAWGTASFVRSVLPSMLAEMIKQNPGQRGW